ncbi:hypothetical protein CEXT_642811 [Caerostris extrusa]|uniref:Uncharacterized protein n=1 Tax=Caerostris extrusa TaxID=172846 RepID=A0AAV4WQ77_CAEEX|nr:hypothetical protein CEXT_642811 [Caerostris extrusa]
MGGGGDALECMKHFERTSWAATVHSKSAGYPLMHRAVFTPRDWPRMTSFGQPGQAYVLYHIIQCLHPNKISVLCPIGAKEHREPRTDSSDGELVSSCLYSRLSTAWTFVLFKSRVPVATL